VRLRFCRCGARRVAAVPAICSRAQYGLLPGSVALSTAAVAGSRQPGAAQEVAEVAEVVCGLRPRRGRATAKRFVLAGVVLWLCRRLWLAGWPNPWWQERRQKGKGWGVGRREGLGCGCKEIAEGDPGDGRVAGNGHTERRRKEVDSGSERFSRQTGSTPTRPTCCIVSASCGPLLFSSVRSRGCFTSTTSLAKLPRSPPCLPTPYCLPCALVCARPSSSRW
jgi:hypothetical protein